MKKILLIILISNSLLAKAQRTTTQIRTNFEYHYTQLLSFAGDNFNSAGDSAAYFLIEMESRSPFNGEILPETRELIVTKEQLYPLLLIERSIKENLTINLFLKEKLAGAISTQINIISKSTLPYYTYDTKHKKLINFVSIRSGNDLFTATGMFATLFMPDSMYVGDNNKFFQRNDDRDYTGSLLLEIGTDYLNALRRRPLKTYQTFLYGFDVYTPYFKDTVIFSTDTSYNILDRPHASFQYFGWSKKGLSKGEQARWTTTLKFGKIGGNNGTRFQNIIHQDISYSPRPMGWGAQIANEGRVGISVECRQEYMITSPFSAKIPDKNSIKNVHFSLITDEKIGTYMTTVSIGAQLSNKTFAQNNMNFINHRVRQSVTGKLHHFMYNVSFIATYVQHNTMLEGYGLVSTMEERNDDQTPQSRYFLSGKQVQRYTYVFNYTLSYTARFATFFYNWKSFSPETKLAGIGINSQSGNEMNIAKRWHHFAEIGMSFNLQ